MYSLPASIRGLAVPVGLAPTCTYAMPYVLKAVNADVTTHVGFERAELVPATGAVRLHLPYVRIASTGSWYRVHGCRPSNLHGLRAIAHLAHALGGQPGQAAGAEKGADSLYGRQYNDAAQAALPQMYYNGCKPSVETPVLCLDYQSAGESYGDIPWVEIHFPIGLSSAPLPIAPLPSEVPAPAGTVGRDNNDADVQETSYKPLANFIKDFTPTKDVSAYLMDEVMMVEGIAQHTGPHMEALIREAEKVTHDKVTNVGVLAMHSGLMKEFVFAIVVFTLEIQTFVLSADEESEFYRQYSIALRRRLPKVMRHLAGYSHFLFSGLMTLPAFEGVLWRGIRGDEGVGLVSSKYVEGLEIHWSSFSSGSPDRSVAVGFATATGLVFKIRVRECARDIRTVSAMPSEQERLILPNTKFVVTQGAHQSTDGMWEVHMMEVKGHFVF